MQEFLVTYSSTDLQSGNRLRGRKPPPEIPVGRRQRSRVVLGMGVDPALGRWKQRPVDRAAESAGLRSRPGLGKELPGQKRILQDGSAVIVDQEDTDQKGVEIGKPGAPRQGPEDSRIGLDETPVAALDLSQGPCPFHEPP